MSDSDDLRGSITGTWHLVDAEADENHLPDHRMDLVVEGEPGRLSGAILSRANDKRIPLKSVTWDGVVFRLTAQAPPNGNQADLPELVMQAAHGRLEGQWIKSGSGPVGPRLKLVRARS